MSKRRKQVIGGVAVTAGLLVALSGTANACHAEVTCTQATFVDDRTNDMLKVRYHDGTITWIGTTEKETTVANNGQAGYVTDVWFHNGLEHRAVKTVTGCYQEPTTTTTEAPTSTTTTTFEPTTTTVTVPPVVTTSSTAPSTTSTTVKPKTLHRATSTTLHADISTAVSTVPGALPRTGSSSTPLAAGGFGAVVIGALAVAFARKKAARA